MMQRHRRDLAEKMSRKYRTRDSSLSQKKIENIGDGMKRMCGGREGGAVCCEKGLAYMVTPMGQEPFSDMLAKLLQVSSEMKTDDSLALFMTDDVGVEEEATEQEVEAQPSDGGLHFCALLDCPTDATTQAAHCLDCSFQTLTPAHYADIQQEIINTFCRRG
jgi:hypothetical protein